LRRRGSRYCQRSFASALKSATGELAANRRARKEASYQPAKLAAIEGRYDTVQPTPLTLVRYFDALSYDFFG
jgi:cytochrome bd-type quinol oxidase subunit 1